MLTSWAELGIRDQRASFCLGISLLRSLHVNGIHGKAIGKVMLRCQVSWYDCSKKSRNMIVQKTMDIY